MYDLSALTAKLVPELRDLAKELNISKFETLKKQELIAKILESQTRIPTDQTSKPEVRLRPRRPKNIEPQTELPLGIRSEVLPEISSELKQEAVADSSVEDQNMPEVQVVPDVQVAPVVQVAAPIQNESTVQVNSDDQRLPETQDGIKADIKAEIKPEDAVT